MKVKIITILSLIGFISGLFLLPADALAGALSDGLSDFTSSGTDLRTEGNIASYIATIINWLLGLIGTVFFVLVLVNGYNYMSAGSDSGKTSSAVSGIVNAVIGLIIVFGAFLITEFAISIVTS